MRIDRIGLRIGSLRQPLRKALLTAGRVGVRGVEVDARSEVRPAEMSRTAIRHFRKLLDDLNLRICGVSFPTRRGFADPDDLFRRIEASQAAMRMAHDLGAREVIVNIGPVGAEGTVELNTLVESLTSLAAFGDRVGARLAALTDADNATELARLCGLLPEGAIGIALDPANAVRTGASPAEVVATLGRYVTYVYASDAVRDRAGGRLRETELGRGTVDLPELLGALEEFGYDGWTTINLRDAVLTEEQAANAAAFLSSL